MKVIKEGYIIPSNRLNCYKCGCIFEYDKEDIIEEIDEETTFDSSLYMNQWHTKRLNKKVQCPTCSTLKIVDSTILSSDLIPFN